MRRLLLLTVIAIAAMASGCYGYGNDAGYYDGYGTSYYDGYGG